MGTRSGINVVVLVLVAALAIPSATLANAEDDRAQKTPECDDPACKRDRERMDREKPEKTSFFDRVHLDVLGTPPETGNGGRLVGIVGAHITIAEFGRVHLFGPPGVMVAKQATGSDASERWRPMTALTWGISIRLIDFQMRGASRRTVMFLNLTKLWAFGNFNSGTDFASLSFAWKKNPSQPRPNPRLSRSTKRTSSATDPTASLVMTRPR
jgi:hypothetical protein